MEAKAPNLPLPTHPAAHPSANVWGTTFDLSVAEQFHRTFCWGGQEVEMKRDQDSFLPGNQALHTYNKPFCWLHPRPQHQGVVKKKKRGSESMRGSWLKHFPVSHMTHKFVTWWGNSLKAFWQAHPVWPVAKKHITFQLREGKKTYKALTPGLNGGSL